MLTVIQVVSEGNGQNGGTIVVAVSGAAGLQQVQVVTQAGDVSISGVATRSYDLSAEAGNVSASGVDFDDARLNLSAQLGSITVDGAQAENGAIVRGTGERGVPLRTVFSGDASISR